MYFTIILYIYIHDYIYILYKKIWNNVFTSMQKLDSHKKKTELGDWGGCSPPPPKKKWIWYSRCIYWRNMHLVTIWNVCWGRTVTVMENVVKHKSSRYSGRIGFNKCPEILFSEPKKGLIKRTLVENICQFLSQIKNTKTNKPQKPTSQNNVKYIPSICITLNLFHNIFSSEIVCEDDFTSEHLLLPEKSLEKFCFSFMVFTFCSKGLKGHKLIQVPHANFFTFLTTFGHSFCLHYQIHGNSEKLSHIFWRILDALLMRFWCTFPFFYILLILQKSTKTITQNLLDQ